MAGDYNNWYSPPYTTWWPQPYIVPQNYCTRCASYYSTPGSCNCFATYQPYRPYPYTPTVPTITWGDEWGNGDFTITTTPRTGTTWISLDTAQPQWTGDGQDA